MALSQMQTDAYKAVLRAVAATQLDWSKEKLLTDLRKVLDISTQEHFEVLSDVMNDKEIEALRENRVLEPAAAGPADAGHGKRKKDALGNRLDSKKQLKKPRHLELSELPLESPSLPALSPLDPGPLGGQQLVQHRGPGRPSGRAVQPQPQPAYPGAPGSSGYEVKRPPGRPPGRQMELVSPADAKRGPGRPPVRQSSQGIVPRGGGGSGSKRGRIGRQLSDLGATPAAAAYGTNELVGRKIWRYWPNEEEQWAEGIITDYRDWSDEHCIVYNINTPRESYEWFRIRDARTPEEYRLVEGYAEDFLDLVSGHQARLKDQSAPRQRHPGRHSKRGGKAGGRGKASGKLATVMSLAGTNGPEAAAAAPAAAAPAVAAEVVGQSPGKPFGKRYLADKLATGTAAELQQMIQALNLRAAEIGLEMQTLEELEKVKLEPARYLELHIKDLAAREKAIHCQLAALSEDAADDFL